MSNSPSSRTKNTGNFFAIGRSTFIRACSLGINPATALLVIARGTGGDNITTKWSAEAISKRLGIRWTTAKTALETLLTAAIAFREEGNRISYRLAKEGDLIWLPNAIVDGVGRELAPVLKLRQMQDPMAVRLFGELYASQNLREDGGISRDVTHRKFAGEKIGQRGQNTVWYFKCENTYVTWGNDVTDPHKLEFTKKDIAAGKSPAENYFARQGMLVSGGLIEWVPYLYEGPKGEPIHPLAWNGTEMEASLYKACVRAARSLLTDRQLEHVDENLSGGWLVAAPAHIANLTMTGIARLRYRPHTRMTAAWWSDYSEKCRGFIEIYDEITSKNSPFVAKSA